MHTALMLFGESSGLEDEPHISAIFAISRNMIRLKFRNYMDPYYDGEKV